MRKILFPVSLSLAAACLLVAPSALAQEEKAADLDSFSVGGDRRPTIQKEEFKIERPRFENSFKMEPSRPSMEGMKFARPQLEILSGPDEPEQNSGAIASANGSRSTPPPAAAGPVGGETRAVQPLSMDPPSYPRDALRRQQEGYVVVEFTINAEGRTEDIAIVEAEPRNAFDREAQRAVARWQFKPALRDGRPVPQRIRHTIEFNLNGN